MAGDPLVTRPERCRGIEDEAHDVDRRRFLDALDRRGVDLATERGHRLVQAGRVDEDELGIVRVSTPRTRWRVVCGLSDTMLTFSPQIALTSEDLPTLGRPTRVTKPERTRAF